MFTRILVKGGFGRGVLPVLLPVVLLAVGCRDRAAEGSVSGASATQAADAPPVEKDSAAAELPAVGKGPSKASNALATALENPSLTPDLFVVYTASSQGYLEPCGCYTKQKEMGGIARRATYVDSLRTTGSPLLLVEAGDFVGGPGEPGEVIGEVTLKAMKAMGYDAIGLGEAELRLGAGFLEKIASLGPPLAHTNWSHPAVGPAQAHGLMIEKAGRKIGVIGLVDPSLITADLAVESLTIDPPGPAAAGAAASLRAAGAELIVVLGHGDFRSSGRIVPLAGAPDIWIVGHGGKELSQPYRLGDTLMLGSGNGGKMVGALRLALPAESAPQYANLLYPLHLTIAEKPAIAALVKTVGPEILHRREPESAAS